VYLVHILCHHGRQAKDNYDIELHLPDWAVLERVLRGSLVVADRRRLSEVIRTLIVRALRDTPRHGRVTVRVKRIYGQASHSAGAGNRRASGAVEVSGAAVAGGAEDRWSGGSGREDGLSLWEQLTRDQGYLPPPSWHPHRPSLVAYTPPPRPSLFSIAAWTSTAPVPLSASGYRASGSGRESTAGPALSRRVSSMDSDAAEEGLLSHVVEYARRLRARVAWPGARALVSQGRRGSTLSSEESDVVQIEISDGGCHVAPVGGGAVIACRLPQCNGVVPG